MKKIVITAASLLFAASLSAASARSPHTATDEERARWTLQDMQSLKIALEAYKSDHHEYPAASSVTDAVVALKPYIRSAPVRDAWGNPFVYERTASGFRIVSAGADGKFDKASWSEEGGELAYEADAVISDQARFWFRAWW